MPRLIGAFAPWTYPPSAQSMAQQAPNGLQTVGARDSAQAMPEWPALDLSRGGFFNDGGPQPTGGSPDVLAHCATATRPRLIIADDDLVVRSVLSMSLEPHFVIVGYAADGEETVALARTTRPDVALVDVEMPRGGGLLAVRGISRYAPGTAVVMLSIDEEDSMVRAVVAAGAMAYCRKDESMDAIAESLELAILSLAHERERLDNAASA